MKENQVLQIGSLFFLVCVLPSLKELFHSFNEITYSLLLSYIDKLQLHIFIGHIVGVMAF
jgi:hypothetical protein